jgi:hypothetical protein
VGECQLMEGRGRGWLWECVSADGRQRVRYALREGGVS